jgi:carbonic anhydrase
VLRSMSEIRSRSTTLDSLIERGAVLLVGGVYDVRTGAVELFDEHGQSCDVMEPLLASA